MPTITMPTSFESSLKSMCEDAVSQAVGILATKHGFAVEEAMRELNLGEIKLVKKRGPSPKTEKKIKKVKDPNAPKRAQTGYQLFSKAERPAAKQHLAEESGDEKVLPQTIMRELASRWKELSSEEQKPWNDQAKQAKAAPEPEPVSIPESSVDLFGSSSREGESKPVNVSQNS